MRSICKWDKVVSDDGINMVSSRDTRAPPLRYGKKLKHLGRINSIDNSSGNRGNCRNRMQQNPTVTNVWNSLSTVMSSLFTNNIYKSSIGDDSASTSVTNTAGSRNMSNLVGLLLNFYPTPTRTSSNTQIKASKYHKIHITNISYMDITAIDVELSECIHRLAISYGYL